MVWPRWGQAQARTARVLSGECPPSSHVKASSVWSWSPACPRVTGAGASSPCNKQEAAVVTLYLGLQIQHIEGYFFLVLA